MRKIILSVMLFAGIILCLSGSASAGLTNIYISGNQVVYDYTNNLYWYPYLTDMLDMTRAEQEGFINQLNCQATFLILPNNPYYVFCSILTF